MKFKGFIFICIFICFISVASVVAADTNETLEISENQNDELMTVETQDMDVKQVIDDNNDLASSNDDNNDLASSTDDKDVLADSPLSTQYKVSVSDTTVKSGEQGSIKMTITPATSSQGYKYDFYFKIYDSNNVELVNENYYSSYSNKAEYYQFPTLKFAPGVYTMKIVNYLDNKVMDTAKLTIGNVYYSAYYVKVSNTVVNSGSSGAITMSITPASSNHYNKYDFYLRIYDSNGVEKVTKRYSSTTASYSETYSIDTSEFTPGKYTVKIINVYDNHLMASANLTMKSVPSSAYYVKVSDTAITPGAVGDITISVKPASSQHYYKYDFYFKICSGNTEKVSQRFYSTTAATSLTYTLDTKTLSQGTYTIKVINNAENQVFSTAQLDICPISLETQDLTGDCDKIIQYKVRAGKNNQYQAGLNVVFTCDGEQYTNTTDDDGYAVLNIHLSEGDYEITTKYGNIVRKNSIVINPVYVENKYKDVYVKSSDGYYNGKNVIRYGWKGNFEGYFRIYEGKKLIYQKKLNSNGYIYDYFKYEKYDKTYSDYLIKDLGTYKAVITDLKGKVLAKSTFKIKKTPTHIKISSIKVKVSSKKSIKAVIYDKSNSRKNIAGTAKFKINGKTYKVKVKKGIAIIKNVKFPSKAKTLKCSVKYLGNKGHKASSKKFKITVKKPSQNKIINAVAKKSTTTKKSGHFKVKTIIFDMWNPTWGDYTYIDSWLYKDGKLVEQTKYHTKYYINGRWTAWKTFKWETNHHRYVVYSGDLNNVKIKVKVNKNVKV